MLFINNTNTVEQQEISETINNFIDNAKKENFVIDYNNLFMNSLKNNLLLAFCLWFAGLTAIGVFVVYGIVCFRGFTLGYTIACIVATIGLKKGIIFIFSSMFLQNIIFIPTIFAISISGIKLYKSIMKERTKENIKLEIIRHTIFSLLFTSLLVVASCIETYISTNIFMSTVNFF